MSKIRKHANAIVALLLVAAIAVMPLAAPAAPAPKPSRYQVLSPITQDNLTIFPIASSGARDSAAFLTLDEGLTTGQVVVTEAGRVDTMPVRAGRELRIPRGDGAEVNRLVLINKSERPLLLLAGEIVTGGKQDRVVGKDRIFAPHSAPVDLSVFCVEPGRWTSTSSSFGGLKAQMAQPSVRRGAMAEKNQAKVWDEVRESHRAMAAAAPAAPPTSATSSYAGVMGSTAVRQEVDRVAAPLERSYEKLLGSLRERKAVGVVVAVNGRIIWADVFPSTALFEKYWPKLVRSYAAEAVVARTGTKITLPPPEAAERFLAATEGPEVAETEPGLYRVSETVGEGYKVFALTSLLPGADYVVHLAKMVTGPAVRPEPRATTQELREPAMVRPRVQW